MMKKILLRVLKGLTVLAVISAIAIIWNPKNIFRADFSGFDKYDESTCVTEEHVIACGLDSKKAEYLYLAVRDFLSLQYIDSPVKIVKSKKKIGDAIGYINGISVAGYYSRAPLIGNAIIFYNGSELTLIHELVHHFYHHARWADRDELFAQSVERYLAVSQANTVLISEVDQLRSALLTYLKEYIKCRGARYEKNSL